ncbi:hypothetical protein F5Y02DRAFT_414942 [Annulohypoxylon stygium]|nr:hypothetical protein F5Y02DRAFT_414942 [Annulohypoxylon stygium]
MGTTSIWFLEELEVYRTVKPYRLDFDPEDEDFPRTNVQRTNIPDVPIQDIRKNEGSLDFTKCGFGILSLPETITLLDMDDFRLVQKQYYQCIERIVEEFTQKLHPGAKAIALDHKFPVSTGMNYDDAQPVLVAHIDWTPGSIQKKLQNVLGNDRTSEILSKNYQFCHAWRPLVGPLNDFPLAVVDYSSVNPETDYELTDDVYEGIGVDENYLLYHRPEHKWY